MKKFLCLFLVVLICLACTACEHEEEGTMFPIKTEMKTDGQLYRGGEVEFPDSLWQTPRSNDMRNWITKNGITAPIF